MIEQLFGMSSAEFLGYWPDRVVVAERHATIADPAQALASLVAELGLAFVAHACAVEIVAGPVPVRPRELIVVGLSGAVSCRIGERELVLAPGAAVFVPRSVERRIDATAEARVLAFSFGVPTWTDMLATTLLHELAAEEPLRAPMFAPLPAELARAREEALELLRAAPPPKARS